MLKKFTKPERAWIMYDWANSAQSSIIVAILLPILYKNIAVASGLYKTLATSYWGYASSLASLLVALAAPVLGTLGDYMGLRKRMFSGFLWVGVGATALLTLPRDGSASWCFSPSPASDSMERISTMTACWWTSPPMNAWISSPPPDIPSAILAAPPSLWWSPWQLYATASLWGPLFSLEAEAAGKPAMRFSVC